MSYKKLVSLFAVSALALGACGTDDAEQPETDETEQAEDVEETEDAAETEESSSADLIEQAQNDSGDVFPDYGLTVTGAWTVDGYVVEYPAGEPATIPVSIITEEETYNVYLLEDGVVAQVVSGEAAVEFVVEEPSADVAYIAGISPDELGAVGDEVAVEDFERFENVILQEAAAAEEAEEE